MVAPYGPRDSIERIVQDLNGLYHAVEATQYRTRHPEIFEQLPPLWSEMLGHVRTDTPVRVLDFGCGTGFEAEQCLAHLEVDELVCYDPSPQMLAECKSHVGRRKGGVLFSSSLDEALSFGPYDVLMTNSVIHHLPDPWSVLRRLAQSMADAGTWIAGHEPSARFYRNEECTRLLTAYRRRRFLDPARYVGWLSRKFGGRRDLVAQVASEAVRAGLFERAPSTMVVDRVVDAYVAHSPEEALGGRGLDVDTMKAGLAQDWDLVFHRTYSFMGETFEGDLPERWKRRASDLAAKFPDDGANFGTVWRRVTAA
jgi:SAM-dependent methyltransferase